MKILNIIEDMSIDYDPCVEKSIKFYQSPNGRELLEILRIHFDGHSTNPKYKMDRTTKKRFKFLMSLVPKC